MKWFSFVSCVVAATIIGCSDNSTSGSPASTLQVVTKSNLSPTKQDGWLYYSFDKDSVINPSSQEGADWDVKFRYVPYDTSRAGIGYLVAVYTQLGPMFSTLERSTQMVKPRQRYLRFRSIHSLMHNHTLPSSGAMIRALLNG